MVHCDLSKIGSPFLPLFDAYIFIDWSAANRATPHNPSADAVWMGQLVRHHCQEETYHRTRNDCISRLLSLLLNHVAMGRRVLVGFDFPYGYPAGFCHSLGFPSGPNEWLEIWTELANRVVDCADNTNNRFAVASTLNGIAGNGRRGPFWGCPVKTTFSSLQSCSPGFPFSASNGVSLGRLRLAEQRLRGTQETWKLYGAGSVGSQALIGIPHVYTVRHHAHLSRCSRVWPFETGFTASPAPTRGAFVLHAEIWPGVVSGQTKQLLTADPSLIRDQAQVRALCQWAESLDDAGQLGQFFDRPHGLTAQQFQRCFQQEGWVLGA